MTIRRGLNKMRLDTYVHLLDEDLPEAIDVTSVRGNTAATKATETDRNTQLPRVAGSIL
jgi:hypothetical protein